MVEELQVLELPLSGLTLVEANAGTGKTWSVTGIYLRLLLESDLEVDQILVMTFTRAATAELRSRLRARIALMLARLADAPVTAKPDEVVENLLARLEDRNRAIAKLSRSLRAFDLAAVQTIHGFCSQVLSRFDFSTGHDSDFEAVEDELSALEPLVRAGWRDLCRGFTPGFAEFVQSQNTDCMLLGRQCVAQWERPWRKVIGAGDLSHRIEPAEASRESAAAEIGQQWGQWREQIVCLLSESENLNKQSYNPRLLERGYLQLDRISSGLRRFAKNDLTDLARLGTAKLTTGCRTGTEPPGHPLFDSVDRFLACHDELVEWYGLRHRSLWLELADAVAAERDTLKHSLQIRSYSDLLLDLQSALSGDRGDLLAAGIAQQYQAALVDEFQDTDPAQYEILSRIYQHLDLPLVFVGDPKQALYGFRGADVFAYLAAKQNAGRIRSLSANWRAVPRLIEQINSVFGRTEDAFLIKDIDYLPSSAGVTDQSGLELDGMPAAALEVLFLPADDAGKSLKAPEAISCAATSVAFEVASLVARGLNGQARVDDRNLCASDIAVLVRSNKQADAIARALSEQQLSCTLSGAGSVWSSPQALDLELICRAIHAPEMGGAVATAICTPLLGVSARDIHELGQNEEAMDRQLGRFLDYRRLWYDYGLSSSLQRVLSDFSVSQQVLAQPHGERVLTNVLHLLDLLQAHAFTTGCSPGELIEWLNLKRLGPEDQSEDALLRLESDQDLVQVLTIHKSKGLQFPVVFCPFAWDASSKFEARQCIEFHQQGAALSATLDLGGENFDEHLEIGLHEAYAEEVRVFYVAVTRAIHQCVVYWGQAPGAQYSPLRYLLHSEPEDHGWRSGLADFKTMQPDVLKKALVPWLEESGIAWRSIDRHHQDQPVLAEDSERQEAGVVARSFEGRSPRGWQVHSYSSIAAHDGFGVRDHDGISGQSRRTGSEHARLTIFDVPGGPDIGSMFHEILEELSSFAASDDEISALTHSKAGKYGLESQFVEPVAGQVRECLLTCLSREDPDLKLAAIGSRERVVEMEFHLSMAACNLAEISRLAGTRAAKGHLSEGFLRGYIDLIFCYEKQYFIVDYKSNYLGDSVADYASDSLRTAVHSADYDLQYHLYCVALHRFLNNSLDGYQYDRHFGGVYYLYLRGMRQQAGASSGVFFDRPEKSVIEGLNKLFIA